LTIPLEPAEAQPLVSRELVAMPSVVIDWYWHLMAMAIELMVMACPSSMQASLQGLKLAPPMLVPEKSPMPDVSMTPREQAELDALHLSSPSPFAFQGQQNVVA